MTLRADGPCSQRVLAPRVSLSTTASTPTAAHSEKDTIVKLLNNIGSREEVQQYVELFSSVESPKFAVIKVGGAILTEELDVLISSLDFLQKVRAHAPLWAGSDEGWRGRVGRRKRAGGGGRRPRRQPSVFDLFGPASVCPFRLTSPAPPLRALGPGIRARSASTRS